MPPGIVLEIVVNDKGTPVVRQFGSSVEGLNKQIRDSGQAVGTATSQTNALSASFLGGAKSAAGFGAAVLGFQSGVAVIQRLTQSFTGFDDALANVNTLIPRQTALQQSLREEILRLPSILGDATTLTEGLYQALSAGIKPGEAVKFVGEAAKLARAGLADMDTTITALTKTMAVYGFDASEAARISDVFFQVVNVGQGTLKQFAGAFPNILVAGKALNVSFEDNAAALATLSAAFKSPDEAATGLVSLFSQLTANADEFLKRGINIREAIAEKGLAGALDALRQVTGGTSTELQKFVGDIQGQQAALTLMNSQYEKYLENTVKVREQTGPTGKALEEQTKTLTSAAKELGVELQKSIAQNAAVDVLGKALSVVIRGISDDLREAREEFADFGKAAEDASKKANEEARQATAGFERELTVRTRAHQEFLAQIEAERKAELVRVEAVAAAFKGLGATVTSDLQLLADGAVKNFQTILEKGTESPTRLRELWEEVVKKIIAAYGTLPPEFAETDRAIRRNVILTTEGVTESFARLGLRSAESLQKLATESLVHFENILKNGDLKGQALLDTYIKITDEINRAGFATLPPEWERVNQLMQETARRAGVELPRPLLNGFQQVQVGIKQVGTDFEQTLDSILAKQIEFGNNYTKALSDTELETAHALGLISRSALEMAQDVRAGVVIVEQELNAFGNAVARASDETERLLSLRIQVDTPFAKDLEGLTKQLRDIERHMAQVANGFFGLDLAGRAFVIKQDQLIIAEIEKRIALLQGAADKIARAVQPIGGGGTTTPTGGGSRPINSPSGGIGDIPFAPLPGPGGDFRNPGAGVLRGGLGGIPDIPGLIFNAAGFIVGVRPGFGRPEGPIPTDPRSPAPGIAPSGSQTIPVLTGPQGVPETPQRGGSHTVAGGTLPGVTFPGGSLRGGPLISINALAITRQGAQELADAMGPALRELQRRGQL